jgi:hypothetical protein
MEFVFAFLPLVLACVVVACGMPFAAWEGNRRRLREAAAADATLIKLVVGTAVAIVLGRLLEFWHAPGAWMALALYTGAAVPLAADRWHRTLGSASPLSMLLAQAPPAEDAYDGEGLRTLLDTLTRWQLKRLREAAAESPRALRDQLAYELDDYALRTDRFGVIVWRSLAESEETRRDALLSMLDVSSDALAAALQER